MINTLGGTTKRIVYREEDGVIAIGFPISGSNVIGDFDANMMVKLNDDGSVSPVAASTDIPFGRLTSTFQNTDRGNVRVITPFESHIRCKANGTLDEGDLLACTGFDATERVPIFKAAVAGDYISAICLKGGATGNVDCEIGILRNPYLLDVPA